MYLVILKFPSFHKYILSTYCRYGPGVVEIISEGAQIGSKETGSNMILITIRKHYLRSDISGA